MEPADYARRIEQQPVLPAGTTERFAGYGVMGLPFASGHVLALRRFPASSIGPGYTSVWHRDPGGAWTFYTTVAPSQSCNRFFGNEVAQAVVCDIELTWPGADTLSIKIERAALDWEAVLTAIPATRALNSVAQLMPTALWQQRAVLGLMARVAGDVLSAGRLGLYGRAPNGQTFIANPLVVWTIASSEARIAGQSLGPVGPLPEQARLGDFWIPQRGLFAIGRAFFEPFDVGRHRAVVSQEAR